jgi:protein-tyrosine phosphatase
MFDLRFCHVERTSEQSYLIRWHASHAGQKVSIYMSDSPDRYYAGRDFGAPILQTTAQQALIANPDVATRHYFYLESELGEGVILAERQLSLQGTPNFRDLGGYETADGRRLKWGKLYRSSKLSALTEIDINYVKRLGLTLICDFRQVIEQQLEPTFLGLQDTHRIASLPVTPGSSSSFIENLHKGIIAVDEAAGFMEEINRDFVSSQLPRYAEMFQLLLAGDQQILIHCASGKDRTGFGAALILDVLGVDEQAIVDDYLLTNKYLPVDAEIERLSKQFTDHSGAAVSEQVLRPMLEVRPEYIRACFEEIRKRFESKEHFYTSALSLDAPRMQQLKDRYLD